MATQTPVFSQRVWRILGAGLIAFVLLGVFGVHFSPVSADRLERRLENNADDALSGREHGWAHVRMDGQRAIVEGRAPSESARLDALSAVLRSTWGGGDVAGGVTRVEDLTTRTEFERVFAFRATALNGRITIVGDAASETAGAAIVDFATQLFPAGQEISLVPAGETGAPAAEWEQAAKRVIAELARLERGTGVMTGRQIGLFGQAGSAQTARSVIGFASDLPPDFSASSYFTDRTGSVHSEINSLAGCDAVIRAARTDQALRFAPGRPELTAMSREAVVRIGEIIASCPPIRLTVSVRVTGDPGEASVALTESRARNIVALLRETGLSADRLDWNATETQTDVIRFEISAAEGE